MKISRMRSYEGPNIYSHFPVVAMLVDLGKYDGRKTTDLPGFKDLLLEVLPGLRSHHCASSRPGGFARRLEDGTYLGHVIEHVALELQALAGWKVVYGKTRQADKQRTYNVVFECGSREGGLEAGRRAVDIVRAAATGRKPDIGLHLEAIRKAAEEAGLGPSTAALAAEAAKRDIPVKRLGPGSLLVLGHGFRQRRVWATVTSRTPCPAVDLAGDKILTKDVLARAGIPVPPGIPVSTAREAVRALAVLGPPVVVKPVDGNQGRGVSLNLSTPGEVRAAFRVAEAHGGSSSPKVLVEKQVAGRHYRLLVVDGRLVAAAERLPAQVTGDGTRTVRELVAEANRDPLRGEGHQRPLTRMVIDAVAAGVLVRQGLTPDSVVEAGRPVVLRENVNLSTGGTARDVTEDVHPDNARLAERVARLVGLDVAGVDVVTPDIARPLVETQGVVLEVNASPGLRMHLHPSEGRPRDVTRPILDSLFRGSETELPAGWLRRGSWTRRPGRIPIIAVTGTNGKTTVARLTAHILAQSGLVVGLASTDGAWVGGESVVRGDCAGPITASAILLDPAVQAAVLETARGGIIRDGLAFDCCDVGVVTNISADHEGRDGLQTLEDVAYVKALVVEAVGREGFAVLNADDPFVHGMASRARGDVVFFSRTPGNLMVRRHVLAGGRAVYLAQDSLVIEWGKDGPAAVGQPPGSGPGAPAPAGPAAGGSGAGFGGRPLAVIPLAHVPMTLGGLLPFQVENAVAAVAATWSLGVPLAAIRRALRSFGDPRAAGYAANAGRFEAWAVGGRTVVLDYGHNRAALAETLAAADRLCRGRLTAVVGAPGDRLDENLLEMGRLAARLADRVIIKEDKDTRGRSRGEVASIFLRGVLDTGFPEARVDVILDERAALERALAEAGPGDWVVVFYEKRAPLVDLLAGLRGRAVPAATLARLALGRPASQSHARAARARASRLSEKVRTASAPAGVAASPPATLPAPPPAANPGAS